MGSRLLSVSIVSGSSVAALLQKVGATEAKRRLGLLTGAKAERDKFIVHQLSSSHEDQAPDPAQIIEQIIAISNQGVVDHLFIECDPETPAFAFGSAGLVASATSIGDLLGARAKATNAPLV